MALKKNDIIELYINDMGENALGVGSYEGFVFFVKDALPGDYVRAVITKINKTCGFAKTLEILTASPDRVTPPCDTARRCGGCQLMELDYKKQLELKKKKVLNDLIRIGGVNPGEIVFEPVIAMDEPCPLHYRNKVQVPVGRNKEGQAVLGFYAGRTHYIVEMQSCAASFEETAVLLKTVQDFINNNNISVYDEKTGSGLVRHVLIRKGFRTGQIMVCLVINSKPGIEKKELFKVNFVQTLKKTGLNITSVCLNINTEKTNVILGNKTAALYGGDFIEDKIGPLTFRISAQSFFQINGFLTEKLYAKALEYAQLTGRETVWDLYCGIGTISLFLAQRAQKVYGVEIIPAAIENAKENASLNGIKNVQFFCGKSEEVFPEFCSENSDGRADVVVLDPPRKGCDAVLLEAIMKAAPERIVYISCSSATLARDIKILSKKYRLEKAAPCDMFAHTMHCEAAALLTRNCLETPSRM